MAEAFPRIGLKGVSEALVVTTKVDMWGDRGDMRLMFPSDLVPPSSRFERAAIMAFDVAAMDEPRNAGGMVQAARVNLVDRMSRALRLSLAERHVQDDDARSDVDAARSILTSLALVVAMEDRAGGLEPSELDNATLESARRRSGVEVSSFTAEEAHAVAMGMADMVLDPVALDQLHHAYVGALTRSSDDRMESRLGQADGVWPQPKAPHVEAPVSASRGPAGIDAPVVPKARGAER